ncbi:ABC transporter permease [Caldinitratiruptor microaerophilus]|uniref:Peptide ABC transporter n=1 Tax=Caldinitratiruptor microaerophilus TaxID=671077 RepID=A0AA35CL35_9FIRM|nr:ABC transporter permease [Caldinitratiruptor microaerophilus]BDG59290.1 peptide ABC transporter [Caldinitratiruptor microaerophilus]
MPAALGHAFRRLLALPAVLVGVTLLTFLLTGLIPGDVAEELILRSGGQPTPEAVAALRAQLGLDDPGPVRYLRWLARVARLDLGQSWQTGEPVGPLLLERLQATLVLTGTALTVGVGVALGLGTWAAARPGGLADRLALGTTLLLRCTPDFVLGFVLLYFLAVRWPVLPLTGAGTWRHLVLPALVLGLGLGATQARLLRASLLEVLREPFIAAARARGLGRRTVLLRHALRAALVPVVTSLGNATGFLLGGSVVVEAIFGWPGVGQLAVRAVGTRDLPVLQGYALAMATLVVVVNLAVDLSYPLLDPRIAVEGGERDATSR